MAILAQLATNPTSFTDGNYTESIQLTNVPGTGAGTHVYAPIYSYPTNAQGVAPQWAFFENATNASSTAVVTVNPNSGPGSSVNSDFTNNINALRAQGIKVLGYVNTSSGGVLTPIATVEAQIDSWYSYYVIDGIHFDTAITSHPNLPYYQNLWTYVQSKDAVRNYVLTNSASIPAEEYMPYANTYCVFEDVQANFSRFVGQSYMKNYASSKFMAIVLNVTSTAQVDSDMKTLTSANVGLVYLTDQTGNSPYFSAPNATVWNETVKDINPNATGGTSITWASSSDTAGVVFTPASGTLATNAVQTVNVTFPRALTSPAIVNMTFSATNNSVVVPWSATRILNTTPSSGLFNDLSIVKQQQCFVYNPSGTFLDIWQDAPLLAGFKETINGATTPLRFQLPRSFDSFDQQGAPGSSNTVAQGNIVQFWLYGPNLPTNGLLRYQGVIDTYEPQIAEDGAETVTITITPFDSVLGDHGVTSTSVNFGTPGSVSTYVDPVTMFEWFFTNNDAITNKPYFSPVVQDSTNPTTSGTSCQFTFIRETMLDVMTQILFCLPANWFFRINPNKTMTLNVSPASAQHVFYIGQNIVNPSYAQDWMTLRNVIVLKGGILNGNTIFQLNKGSDVSTFGERIMLVDETRVTDANTASTLGNGYLNAYDRVSLRAKVRVPDFRGQYGTTGLGYDIESLHVGDTVQILDALSTNSTKATLWDQSHYDVDYWDVAPGAALNQVVVIQSIDYYFDYVDLELGLLQPSQDRALFNIQNRLQKYALT